jgi:hypothetical protein
MEPFESLVDRAERDACRRATHLGDDPTPVGDEDDFAFMLTM